MIPWKETGLSFETHGNEVTEDLMKMIKNGALRTRESKAKLDEKENLIKEISKKMQDYERKISEVNMINMTIVAEISTVQGQNT